VLATVVAVTVALPLVTTLAGASYSTEVLVCLLSKPGPANVHETPLPDGSLATVALIVTLCPCPIVCELPPPKLTEIFGGGVLAAPPHPVSIAVSRYATPTHPNISLLNIRSCSCIFELTPREFASASCVTGAFAFLASLVPS